MKFDVRRNKTPLKVLVMGTSTKQMIHTKSQPKRLIESFRLAFMPNLRLGTLSISWELMID